MIMTTAQLLATLHDKCCDQCGDPIEEMADCYDSTCVTCKGLTFYPLGPAPHHPPET